MSVGQSVIYIHEIHFRRKNVRSTLLLIGLIPVGGWFVIGGAESGLCVHDSILLRVSCASLRIYSQCVPGMRGSIRVLLRKRCRSFYVHFRCTSVHKVREVIHIAR